MESAGQLSSNYYIKMQGRILGPFALDSLQQMAANGQLSRVHMLSSDKNNWFRASEISQLFERPSTTTNRKAADNSAKANAESANTKQASQNQADSPKQTEWYFTSQGQQSGPVEFGHMAQLIQKRKIKNEDLVWREGWADWKAVASVAELAGLIPDDNHNNPILVEVRSEREASRHVEKNSNLETSRILRSSNPWAYFICIAGYVFSALTFFSAIAGIVVGARTQVGALIGQSVITLLFGGVFVTASIFLNHHISCASRFVSTENVLDLNNSLNWLRRLWLLVSICLIFMLVVALALIIMSIAIGIDLSAAVS
jgi:GYF domain 2